MTRQVGDCRVGVGERFFVTPQGEKHNRAIRQRLGRSRHHRQGGFKQPQGRFKPALCKVDDPKQVEGVEVTGPGFKHAAVPARGASEVARLMRAKRPLEFELDPMIILHDLIPQLRLRTPSPYRSRNRTFRGPHLQGARLVPTILRARTSIARLGTDVVSGKSESFLVFGRGCPAVASRPPMGISNCGGPVRG